MLVTESGALIVRRRNATMHRRLIHHALGVRQLVFCLGISFLASSADLAQPGGRPQQPVTHQTEEATPKETTMRGCLGGRPNDGVYYLNADTGGYFYLLGGNTSLLKDYVGKEVSLRGNETSAVAPSRFEVTASAQVFDVPCPIFKPSFSGGPWHTGRNRKYGVESSYPADFTRTSFPESGNRGGNFVTDQCVVPIARFSIPGRIYPNSNFAGGAFGISSNTEIGNGPSCRQFGFSDPQFASSHNVHGIHYSEMKRGSAAMGTSYSNYQLHTFQNGFCYEVSFEFREGNPGNIEHKIRVLGGRDELNLIQTLIQRVQFSRPTAVPVRKNNPQAVPQITRFVASSQTANNGPNNEHITFSWTTRDTDYADLSCKLVPPTAGKVPATVMAREGYPCFHVSSSLNPRSVQYLPPNASQTLSFYGYRGLDSVPVVVRLTPFAYGKAYPDSARSIPIQVNPWNQFSEGVPAADGKVALSYPVRTDGTTKLQQGSSLTIRWTDAVPHDPCVNLYLVQDVGRSRATYHMQLGPWGGKCFSPASSGSYTWTIPNRFSGAGFRIYSQAPGGSASGLGAPFSIVPATPGRRGPAKPYPPPTKRAPAK